MLRIKIGKLLLLVISSLFCIISISCQNIHGKSYNAEMFEEAESLLWVNPDSVRKILSRIDTLLLSEEDKKHYELLRDNVILRHDPYSFRENFPLVNFSRRAEAYLEDGDNLHAGQAYFLAGLDCNFNQEYHKSITYLEEAAILFEKVKASPEWQGTNIYMLGITLYDSENYIAAYEMYKRSLPYIKQTSYNRLLAGIYRDIALYEYDNDYPSLHYQACIDTALQIMQTLPRSHVCRNAI